MVDINYNDYGVAAALNNMAEAQQMQAMRPQKSRVYTRTTSTPRELEDMIVRRNMIGAATRELDDALKAREGYKYSLGTALAGLPQQQGPGSWLSAFARSFGAGMAAPTAAQVDRAQKKYEAEIRDLNTAIALDKAMGETQGQTQTIRYDELPYSLGGGKGGTGDGSSEWKDFDWSGLGPQFDLINFVKDNPRLYDSIAQLATETDENDRLTGRGLVARQAISNEDLGLRSSTLDEVRKVAGARLTKAVKELGGARGVDTMREAVVRVGQILGAPVQTNQEYAANLENARQEMLKGINNSRVMQGLQPISNEQFNRYWNSMWNVPLNLSEKDKAKYVTYPTMTNSQPVVRTNTETQKYDYSKYGF